MEMLSSQQVGYPLQIIHLGRLDVPWVLGETCLGGSIPPHVAQGNDHQSTNCDRQPKDIPLVLRY